MNYDFTSDIGLRPDQLDTPALLLDLDILCENIEKMASYLDSVGIGLRPHVKSHKCSGIARYQLSGGAVGISTASLSEAMELVRAGISNILITSPITCEHKMMTLTEIASIHTELMTVVEDPEYAVRLNEAAKTVGTVLKVLVNIDSGSGRTGIKLGAALKLGKQISAMTNLQLCGIQCYCDKLQQLTGYNDRKLKSFDVMSRAVKLRETFLAEGLECQILTGGGTGTFDIDAEITGITDIQAGAYCLMDARYRQVDIGDNDCGFNLFEPAASVLTTVVSSHGDNSVIVDAGYEAIYHIPGIVPHVIEPAGKGYKYEWIDDTYGRITFPKADSKPQNGEKIRLSLTDCAPTVNLYDCYHVTSQNRVVHLWPIDLRGCCR